MEIESAIGNQLRSVEEINETTLMRVMTTSGLEKNFFAK